MRHPRIALALLVVSSAMAGPAMAGACDAPFMHEGGSVQLRGTGNIGLGADLSFAEVAKQGGDNCRARVQGVASFSLGGLPPSKRQLDYLMTVKSGQASFVRYDRAGEQPAKQGQFDLRILGLFAYDRIESEGQRLPGGSYQLSAERDAPVGGQGTTVRIGEKTVGAPQRLETVLGTQQCWPIGYSRDTEPTQATFNGITLPIPGMKTQVTDWFCPKVSLVMKQDIDLAGTRSTVEITQLK